MNDQQAIWLVGGGLAILIVVIIAFASRRSSALGERLIKVASGFGWEGVRRIWWNGAIRGRWRGVEAELRHMARYKGVPERLLMTLKGASPARVIVKRRGSTLLSKPMTLFGPPLVEPMNFADQEQYWIRSDQQMFVETLFARREIGPALAPNLIAGFDFVDLDSKRLRILRAVDDSAVKKRFGRPFITWGRDLELIETIAVEEWQLASVLVESMNFQRGN